MTATAFEIADHWQDVVLATPDWTAQNWMAGRSWDVDATTYINGVVCTIDLDFEVGYLLQIGDRSEKGATLSYLAIVQRPALPDTDDAFRARGMTPPAHRRDVAWFEGATSQFDAIRWFVNFVEETLEAD